MSTNTIVLIIVVALAALVLVAALVWAARNKRNQSRHDEAETIRSEARDENRHVAQREARAEETAAKARAVQAEADVKTAQAKGLQQEAAGHRHEATNSRDDLNEQFERADALDPATRTPNGRNTDNGNRNADNDQQRPTAGTR